MTSGRRKLLIAGLALGVALGALAVGIVVNASDTTFDSGTVANQPHGSYQHPDHSPHYRPGEKPCPHGSIESRTRPAHRAARPAAAIGAVRSGRTRFVSGRSQSDAARGPPLPNTALCNTPSGAVSADKALAVALGPLGTFPGSPYPTGGNGAGDPESAGVGTISTNCIHSISIGRTFRFRTQ